MDEMKKIRLTQEKYRGNPWKVLVTCLMLNKTSGSAANPVIEKFLKKWPTPKDYVRRTEEHEALEMIRPLGLYNVREMRLDELADALVKRTPYDQIPGVGKYGRDSYLIFVEGRLDVTPEDKKLKVYLAEQKKCIRRKQPKRLNREETNRGGCQESDPRDY